MADISKITLPSGTTYDIKDSVARQMIAGGISFILAWNGQSTPVPASIPGGVVVKYNGTNYTGTLSPDDAQLGAFYLIKTSTEVDDTDSFDEYVVVSQGQTKFWEKLGDTTLDLSDVVTDVALSKSTDTVIGTDATFTITQPTISMSTSSSSGTGKIPIVTGISSVEPSSDDEVTVITGYSNSPTDNFVKTLSSTTKKLATTTITGVSGSTTASKATSAASQTTADGTYTVVAAGMTANNNILCNIGIDENNAETLVIKACTLDTQTTTQQTFSDITVPVAASAATTVATGSTASSGSGAQFLTAIAAGSTASALTGLGTAATDTVLGVDTTFGGTASTAYAGATATGANTAWNNKDSVTVLTNNSSVTVTKGT